MRSTPPTDPLHWLAAAAALGPCFVPCIHPLHIHLDRWDTQHHCQSIQSSRRFDDLAGDPAAEAAECSLEATGYRQLGAGSRRTGFERSTAVSVAATSVRSYWGYIRVGMIPGEGAAVGKARHCHSLGVAAGMIGGARAGIVRRKGLLMGLQQ